MIESSKRRRYIICRISTGNVRPDGVLNTSSSGAVASDSVLEVEVETMSEMGVETMALDGIDPALIVVEGDGYGILRC